MPVKKMRLSSAQRARYLEHAQELQSAGIDCDIPDEWLEHSRSLEISVGPQPENILCELPSGVTAYAIQVYLVAIRGNLILKDFSIASEWDPKLVALSANGRGLYGVGSAFEFVAHEVLNHRFETGIHFRRRGDIAEGWLVASGLKPIPDKYPNRIVTELTLTFTDQFGQPYAAQAQAILERSARKKGKCAQGSRQPIGVPQTEPANNNRATGQSIGTTNLSNLRLRPE